VLRGPRCATMICSLPPKIEIAEAGKRPWATTRGSKPNPCTIETVICDTPLPRHHILTFSSTATIACTCLEPVDLTKSVAIFFLEG
jgi:hypothetical protein